MQSDVGLMRKHPVATIIGVLGALFVLIEVALFFFFGRTWEGIRDLVIVGAIFTTIGTCILIGPDEKP